MAEKVVIEISSDDESSEEVPLAAIRGVKKVAKKPVVVELLSDADDESSEEAPVAAIRGVKQMAKMPAAEPLPDNESSEDMSQISTFRPINKLTDRLGHVIVPDTTSHAAQAQPAGTENTQPLPTSLSTPGRGKATRHRPWHPKEKEELVRVVVTSAYEKPGKIAIIDWHDVHSKFSQKDRTRQSLQQMYGRLVTDRRAPHKDELKQQQAIERDMLRANNGEGQIILDGVKDLLTWEMIAEKTGKDLDYVQKRGDEIKAVMNRFIHRFPSDEVSVPPPLPPRSTAPSQYPRAKHPWTKPEEEELMDSYIRDLKDEGEIAQHLGRTLDAVKQRRQMLQYRRDTAKWTKYVLEANRQAQEEKEKTEETGGEDPELPEEED